jgi:RHS repeat-associated protein
VGYVHAGGIDQPLGMIRNDTAVVLLRDHRGLYAGARNTAGAALATNVPWPSTSWSLYHRPFDPRENHTWVGSLPIGQLDHTGLLYRRNRYYDAESAQFTQPDPIGIAGGINLYGYAGGDPINKTDPYGLCPPEDPSTFADCNPTELEAIEVTVSCGGCFDPYSGWLPDIMSFSYGRSPSDIWIWNDGGGASVGNQTPANPSMPQLPRCAAAGYFFAAAVAMDAVTLAGGIGVAVRGAQAASLLTKFAGGTRYVLASRAGLHSGLMLNTTGVARIMGANITTHAAGVGMSAAVGDGYSRLEAIASYIPIANMTLAGINWAQTCFGS